MILAVIPARGGSKRIPRKNIKDFCGRPIITYSIEAALLSGCFDRVIVSTDDEEIASVAIESGAEVPFVRPDHLSDDYTGTIPVIKHAIQEISLGSVKPEFVCCIYPTAPLLSVRYVHDALKAVRETNADYAISVTSYPFPIQRSVRVSSNGRLEMLCPEYFPSRSQDLEEFFHDAGQFYAGRACAWLNEKKFFDSGSIPIRIPRHRVQDIDTVEDWVRAEMLFKLLAESDAAI